MLQDADLTIRLAHAGVDSGTLDQHLRRRMHRMWWWLGREEFWGRVQDDTCYCLQITLMIFLLAWASKLPSTVSTAGSPPLPTASTASSTRGRR